MFRFFNKIISHDLEIIKIVGTNDLGETFVVTYNAVNRIPIKASILTDVYPDRTVDYICDVLLENSYYELAKVEV